MVNSVERHPLLAQCEAKWADCRKYLEIAEELRMKLGTNNDLVKEYYFLSDKSAREARDIIENMMNRTMDI